MRTHKKIINNLLVGGVLFLTKAKGVLARTSEFCAGAGPRTADPKINTALGCIPVKIDSFVTWLLPSLFGVAGGIAFLLMVYGFISLATSGGQPDKVKGARETITSAITGLVVSVGALFILRLIVVDIIKLPGF